MVEMRWPGGVHCRGCGSADVRFRPDLKLWQCRGRHPRNQFSAKVGTIFEDSSLDFGQWFVAVWAVANCRSGVSSHVLARLIGVTQKTAWRMLHRVRLTMQTDSFVTGRWEAPTHSPWAGYAQPKPPPENGVADEEGECDPEAGLERFNRLIKGLLGVPRDELAEAERRYQNERLMRRKRGRSPYRRWRRATAAEA
jgi:hypothetical protein